MVLRLFWPKMSPEEEAKLEAARRAAGMPDHDPEKWATKAEVAKIKVMSAFLLDVFSGPDQWYPVTQHLCRHFFPLPHGVDGWLYPAVKRRMPEANVCLLDAHARHKLRILEVLDLVAKPGVAVPRLLRARRVDGDELVPVAESMTADRVLGEERPGLGFWNRVEVDYVDEADTYWPPQ